jgi:hypothetical protein
MPKLCIDCKYSKYEKRFGYDPRYLCFAVVENTDYMPDIVTGKNMIEPINCELMRRPLGICGEEAKLFVKRPWWKIW